MRTWWNRLAFDRRASDRQACHPQACHPQACHRQTSHSLAFASAVSLMLLAATPSRALDYLNIRVQNDEAVPSACLSFSSPIAKTDPSVLAAYVDVQPRGDHALEVRGKDLCIRGLKHGETYTIHLKKGLLGTDGTFIGDVSAEAKVPDRDAQVSFNQGKTILPLSKGVGLPLNSVNVLKAHVVLYRFNDRAMVDHLGDDWFGQELGYDGTSQIQDRSTKVFDGTLDINAVRNAQVSTTLPIATFIKDLQPGVYVAVANDAAVKSGDETSKAAQWFSVSDIGLTSIKANGGLLVVARSLKTALPKPVSVRLMSRANEILGTYRTDGDGRFSVPAGLLRGEHGEAPQVLVATDGAGSFTWLRLDDPALDLSDLDMKGRAAPATTDAFVWTDRGIYRPGETVHLGLLVRDRNADPVDGLPAAIHIVRPDGVEVETRKIATPTASGGTMDYAVPDNAFSGTWTFWVSAGGKDRVGATEVLVQDFVPPRLEAKASLPAGDVTQGGPIAVDVQASYFYGSPGADLTGSVEGTISVSGTPFAKLAGFRFGLVQDSFRPEALAASDFTTDDKGNARVELKPATASDTTHPLQVEVRATVNDVDGRPAVATATTMLRTSDHFVGVKPRFDELSEGAPAIFDIALVNFEGGAVGKGSLKWDLVREDYTYNYFYRDGRWQWHESIIDFRTKGGEVALDATGKGLVTTNVSSGRWRLEVYDPTSTAATSVRFHSGWWAVGQSEDRKPVVMNVTVDPNPPAGKVRAMVEPSFAGRVLVVLDGNGLHGAQELDMKKGGGPVEFDAADVPPSGAYVLAIAVSPSGTVVPRLPVRSVGLAWVPGSASARKLDVAIGAPATIKPKTDLIVDLTAKGLAPGETGYVTLAAVDEAVLRMTSFASPDAGDHFLGRRQPDLELRDVYNTLIDPVGTPGVLKEGGDGANANVNMGGLDVKTFKTVALFKGPVAFDADGHAKVSLPIPDFSGRLRLMAVAWSPIKFGKAERPVTVRPPLLAELTLPRFLAPGDKIRARVLLTDLEAPEQDYAVAITTKGAVSIDRRDAMFEDVKRDRRRFVDRTLSAAAVPGVGRIHMVATGKDGTTEEHDFEISVRTPNAFVTKRQVVEVAPGGKLTVDDALGDGLTPGTGKVALSASTTPAIDVPGLLASLRRYPYGCAEQTISRAFPELLAKQLGADLPAPTPDAITGQGALERLTSLQSTDGSFGYWTVFDNGNFWLTAYAVDFMQHAREAGLSVPEGMEKRATAWLSGQFASVGLAPLDVAGASYASIILSRAGKLDLSQLRYVASRVKGSLPTEAAKFELAAALTRVGERDMAAGVLAAPRVERLPRTWLNDYGSPLRDEAMVLSLMAEEKLVPRKALFERALELSRATTSKQYLSTQEETWLLRVAADLKGTAPLAVEIDGRANPAGAKEMHAALPLAPGKSRVLANLGKDPVYTAISVTGIPTAAQPADANGYTMTREFKHLDGSPVDLADVHQNDEIVVVLTGGTTDDVRRKSLVVDMFPAGLEPEPIGLATDRTDGQFAWLKGLVEPTFFALRDDRYMAGIDLAGGFGKTFTLAYVTRAVTPGTFALPGPQVEDMYEPGFHARGASATLEVKPARKPVAVVTPARTP